MTFEIFFYLRTPYFTFYNAPFSTIDSNNITAAVIDLILPGVQLSTLESKDDSENRATMGQMAYLSQTGGTKWAQGGFLWLQGHTHTHT